MRSAARLAYRGYVITDDELTGLALAADRDAEVPDDAVPFGAADGEDGLLPSWYFPMRLAGGRRLRGWHRRVIVLMVVTFLLVSACGLCCTYGSLVMA